MGDGVDIEGGDILALKAEAEILVELLRSIKPGTHEAETLLARAHQLTKLGLQASWLDLHTIGNVRH